MKVLQLFLLGLFIALPIAAVAFRRRRDMDARERSSALAAVAAAPAALASVMIYERLTVGSALAFSQAQKEWGRRLSPKKPSGIAPAIARKSTARCRGVNSASSRRLGNCCQPT